MRNIMAGFLIFLSSAAYADINLYGPGGPHTALLDAAKLYAEKTGIIVNVHYGPQNKWNEDAKKKKKCRYLVWRIRTICSGYHSGP